MNGVVVIDKPSGRTSHDVCVEVRRVLGAQKAGHTGTLDPLATGVLPVCLDEATKLMPLFSEDDKDYRAVLLLGVETDTLDMEGTVTRRSDPAVTEDEIVSAVRMFQGEISQVPPRYSAIKYRGKSMYKWARRGVVVEPAPRKVEIRTIKVDEISLPRVTISVSCSKGTYVRSLCADIGRKLRCGACLFHLRRTRSGSFGEECALPLESLRNGGPVGITSMLDALPRLPAIDIDERLAVRVRKGYQPVIDVLKEYHIPFLAPADMVKLSVAGRSLVAVARMLYSSEEFRYRDGKEQAVRVVRVFDD